MFRKWNAEEMQCLKQHLADSLTNEEISDLLKRPIADIREQRLIIRQMVNSPWSAKQDEDLRTLWEQGASTLSIAAVVNRSKASVLARAIRLGLKRKSRPGRKAQSKVYRKPHAEDPCKIVNMIAALKIEDPVIKRKCLNCTSPFTTTSPYNRVCGPCKSSTDWHNPIHYNVHSLATKS